MTLTHKREFDPWIVVAAIVLVILGVLNMVALGMFSYATRQACFAGLGIVVMLALSRLRISDIRRFGWVLLGVSTVLLLAVPVIGVAAKGAQRWLDLGAFTIQPSDLAELALILALANVLAGGYTLSRLAIALSIAAVPVILVLLQPNLSTAILLAAVAALMLILARVPLLPLAPLFAAAIAALPLAVLVLRPYQLDRLHVFLSNKSDQSGSGWAALQANIAIGSGGLWGMAGDPTYRLRGSYVPEPEHDLAFASLIYGWGLFAGLAVVAAILIIVWRCVVAARMARTRGTALIAAGVGALFGLEATVSIGVNLSLIPHTGQPIPLFSYGGTTAVMHLVALGLVLAVRRDGVELPLWAPPRKRRRLPRGVSVGALAVTASLLAMSVFAWQLQDSRGAKLRAMGLEQMTRCIRLPAERGQILDDQGVPLAVNVPEYSVSAVAGMFDAADSATDAKLAGLLRIPTDELSKRLHDSGGEINAILGRVDADQARGIIDAHLPGVLVVPTGRRFYPQGSALGPVLGYVGVADRGDMQRWPNLALGSRVGKAGLERQYDALLRGIDGKQCVYVDPAGHPRGAAERVDPIRGYDLRLHLDLGLQQLADQVVADVVHSSGGDMGGAVVMDVRTGAVLALASVPGFDNNVYGPPPDLVALAAQSNTPGAMLNHDTQTASPPGSTFKLVMAAANAEYGVLSPDAVVPTGAAFTYGGQTYRNWEAMGPHNLMQAIQWSDNVYFYKLALMLGPERIAAVAHQLGVGEPSGIDLPGEISGFLGTPENIADIGATWYPGSTVIMGIGQGAVATTPIQVARWTSGVATGAMVTPQLAASYGNATDTIDIPTAPPQPLPFADKLGPVREGMRLSASAGTGGQLATLRVPAGSKTGTAEDPSAPGQHLDAWFTAVAPYGAPDIVVTAYVRGGGGSTSAGPIIVKLMERYFARPPAPPSR
ncbi:cell division protein [Skermania sp. ID1734]|uniref:FtsW/RodA/SpoVE family cell cycle protein n=1 Tax=Skermania sp. ID1734 TaxID=2597516 RepID=UPI00117CDA4D|nr:FtsW/RodA/SpoVE family cell cycle protein [Skermania sp. ID1734]TSE00374.1 cell division protein [Skermania sp. ID1734]